MKTDTQDKTIIELTHEDAQLFLEFQKRYEFMKFLRDSGAFNMRNGHLTVHFSKLGEIIAFDLVERTTSYKLRLPI
jgi:hypothetical protein